MYIMSKAISSLLLFFLGNLKKYERMFFQIADHFKTKTIFFINFWELFLL